MKIVFIPRIFAFLQEIMVVGNLRQIGKFEIVNAEAETFRYHLSDGGIDDSERFSTSRRSNDHRPTEWIDIDPALVDFFAVSEEIRDIYRGVRFHQFLILGKTFFLHIPSVFSHFLLHEFRDGVCSHLKDDRS